MRITKSEAGLSASLLSHPAFVVPAAHAANITSLSLLTPTLCVTSGADSRLCLWQLQTGEEQVRYKMAAWGHMAAMDNKHVRL